MQRIQYFIIINLFAYLFICKFIIVENYYIGYTQTEYVIFYSILFILLVLNIYEYSRTKLKAYFFFIFTLLLFYLLVLSAGLIH